RGGGASRTLRGTTHAGGSLAAVEAAGNEIIGDQSTAVIRAGCTLLPCGLPTARFRRRASFEGKVVMKLRIAALCSAGFVWFATGCAHEHHHHYRDRPVAQVPVQTEIYVTEPPPPPITDRVPMAPGPA